MKTATSNTLMNLPSDRVLGACKRWRDAIVAKKKAHLIEHLKRVRDSHDGFFAKFFVMPIYKFFRDNPDIEKIVVERELIYGTLAPLLDTGEALALFYADDVWNEHLEISTNIINLIEGNLGISEVFVEAKDFAKFSQWYSPQAPK